MRFLVRGIVSTCDIDRLYLLGFDMDVNDIEFHLIVMQLLEDTSLSTREMGQLYCAFVYRSEKWVKRQEMCGWNTKKRYMFS